MLSTWNLNRNKIFCLFLLSLLFFLIPELSFANTLNTQLANGDGGANAVFEPFYKFIEGAATGYVGRSICIIGGLIGLGLGARNGSVLPAISGVLLGIMGVLGPTIINGFYTSALI